jgi:hypothetical protein
MFSFKVFNKGPSSVSSLKVAIYIPDALVSASGKRTQIVDLKNVEVKGSYSNKVLESQKKMSDGSVSEMRMLPRTNENLPRNNSAADQVLKNLPSDRTIYLECDDPESIVGCAEITLDVSNFDVGEEPIEIQLNFSADFSKIGWFHHHSNNTNLFKFNFRQKLQLHRLSHWFKAQSK